MIYSITFKNFFSFKDKGSLSLRVNDNAPQTEKYFLDNTGERLSKVLSVFGYNASGKTNALKPIAFLQWLIIGSYVEDPDKEIPIIPFKFVDKKGLTEVSIKFSIGQDLYLYYVKLTAEKIINEKLQKKLLGKKKFITLFERVWDNNENNYTWKDNFSLGARFQKRLRKNSSILAIATRDNHKESVKISNFWKNVSTNLDVIGKIDDEAHNIFSAAEFFNNNPALKEKANQLLKKFDLGLKAIDIEKKKETDRSASFGLRGVHYNDYKLDFPFESSGTKKLFAILKNILYALDRGGIAVLDEFDTDLYPMMSEALLEMFFSKETNPKNAQLIFSAHNPYLLNLLDKYQIAFTEKDAKGESEIWRLDKMKGVRSDDNYYVKYLSGAYGAVPDLDL